MAQSLALNNVFKARDLVVSPTEPRFGAAGDGTTNDTAAVLAALQSGKIVDGGGKTYGISGSMQPSSFVGLRNAKLKQLAPGSVGIKTLHIVDKNDWFLQNVSVDCGSDQDSGNISNNAGIWVDTSAGTSKRWWMDNVEVKNGGPMNGIAIWNSADFSLKGCSVRDFIYNLSPDPSDDVIQGIWLNNCSNFSVADTRIRNLTGFLLGVASKRYSRGFAISGACAHFAMNGCVVESVDQAYDVTGSSGAEEFVIDNCIAADCGTEGFKFANSPRQGRITGCLAVDCGRHGYHVSGMTEVSNPLVIDLVFSNCHAQNCGSNGIWATTRYAFYVEAQGAVDTSYPRGVKFIGCSSVDTQGTPTTDIAFVNSVVGILPTASGYNVDWTNEIIDCSARGWLSSFQSGFHFPICALSDDDAQSIPNNAWTTVLWDTEVSDTANMHSTAANTGNIYIKKAGFYVIKAHARWAVNATNDRRLRPMLNGVEVHGANLVPGHATIQPECTVVSPPYFMTPGDVVRIEAFQESGGALDLVRQAGFFSVEKVA